MGMPHRQTLHPSGRPSQQQPPLQLDVSAITSRTRAATHAPPSCPPYSLARRLSFTPLPFSLSSSVCLSVPLSVFVSVSVSVCLCLRSASVSVSASACPCVGPFKLCSNLISPLINRFEEVLATSAAGEGEPADQYTGQRPNRVSFVSLHTMHRTVVQQAQVQVAKPPYYCQALHAVHFGWTH